MEAYSIKPLVFHADHMRSKTAYNNRMDSKILGSIAEVEEWCSTETRSVSKTPAPALTTKRKFMKRGAALYNQPENYSPDPQVAEHQKFLRTLQKYYEVYDYFIKTADDAKVIRLLPCGPAEYYYRYIHFSNNSRLQTGKKSSTAPQARKTPPAQKCSTPSNFSDRSEVFDPFNKHEKSYIDQFIKTNREAVVKNERKVRPISRKRKLILPRRVILSRNKPKLMKIFQTMCGTPSSSIKSCRLTNYLFKIYLQKKFPIEMAEGMSKHFDFKSSNFEEFCVEMDRFICGPDEKHFSLCFDAFDLNKDKYICYQDTYAAIELRKENLFDSDLVKIKNMFEMKKQGLAPVKRAESRKGRRMSVVSLASEISSFYDEESKEKRIPHVHPDKPEAITLEDFQRIEFKNKPQLLSHFFAYTCHFDIEKSQEITHPVVKYRKESQDIIVDMLGNPGNCYIDSSDPKAAYYEELENAMALFNITEATELLNKFEILRDKTTSEFKTISKQSMIENWPKLFGAKCDYVSERYYQFFAGPKYVDVTKAHFLRLIHSIKEDEYSIKMFSFAVYDKRGDKKITADEIYKMEQALPEGSPIYNECIV